MAVRASSHPPSRSCASPCASSASLHSGCCTQVRTKVAAEDPVTAYTCVSLALPGSQHCAAYAAAHVRGKRLVLHAAAPIIAVMIHSNLSSPQKNLTTPLMIHSIGCIVIPEGLAAQMGYYSWWPQVFLHLCITHQLTHSSMHWAVHLPAQALGMADVARAASQSVA